MQQPRERLSGSDSQTDASLEPWLLSLEQSYIGCYIIAMNLQWYEYFCMWLCNAIPCAIRCNQVASLNSSSDPLFSFLHVFYTDANIGAKVDEVCILTNNIAIYVL